MKRIGFLDGLRGLAIILVLLYHAYYRWASIVPYKDSFSDYFFIRYGYLGVELFFLISGFVILMSLEKSSGFFSFFYKRWRRLFPAMLIATILIYFTAFFLYERPFGIPKLNSIIPGLTFVSPIWIKKLTGIVITPLEGAFWSLYVEVVFYLVFGLIYFFLGKKKAVLGIFLMYLLSIIAKEFHLDFLTQISNGFFLKYFCWFAAGSLAYLYFIDKERKYLLFAFLICLLEIFQYRYDIKLLLFYIFILSVFFLPICFEKIRIIFNNQIILFFGFISYPFYLIHENAMIAMICKQSKMITIPYILLPVLPVIILVLISYLIAKILEPSILKMIIQIEKKISKGFFLKVSEIKKIKN